MNRKKNKRIAAILIVILIATIIFAVYQFIQVRNLTDENLQLNETISTNTQCVYVPLRDMKAGEVLIDDSADGEVNVEMQNVATGLESFMYITESDIGKQLTVDVSAGVPIMTNMVTDVSISADTREFEIAVAQLMTDQAENDFVDVRITYPNGEDYLVLSKKQVMGLKLDSCVFYSYLNEEEIIRLKSAIYDAYVMDGCTIYTTRYVESNLQEEATPNYLVKATNIDLINSDPNVLTKATDTLNLQARLGLEERLSQVSQDQQNAMQENIDSENSVKNEIIANEMSDSEEESVDDVDYEENTEDTSDTE